MNKITPSTNQVKVVKIQPQDTTETEENDKEKCESKECASNYDELRKQILAEVKEYIRKEKHAENDSWCVKGIFWFACSVFTGFAGYNMYRGVANYLAEPLMANVNIKQNKTFEWPTFTLSASPLCFNTTVLYKLITN